MKRIPCWATLTLLICITGCSSGGHPGGAPSSPPQAVSPVASAPPVTSVPPAASAPPVASVPPAPAQAPAGAPPAAGSSQTPAPVLSLRRAFALVGNTTEAQEVIRRLGSKLVMVNMSRTAQAYQVSLGENLPERVRFVLHFTVSRADGTVRYTEPTTGQEKPATPVVPARDPVTVDAESLLGRGDTQAAVDLLTKAVADRPAADTWNLLSYAHLISGRWQAAVDAGQKALQLDEFHPYALYNTGMAEVALKQYPGAISHLRDAIEVEPQRPEPYLALSRAYQETGRYALAADVAALALKLAPGDADALKRQAAVDSMVSHTAPTDLTAAATVWLEDGPYAIYLYPGTGEKSPAVVYLKGPEGVVGLPVGRLQSERGSAFTRVNLPGGAVGYLLSGEPVGAYVAQSQAWRLFVRDAGGQFRQVRFVGEDDPFVQPVEDFFRSGGRPSVEGDRLVADYGDDASGKSTVKVTWQLLSGEAKAIQVESTPENRDPNK